MAPISLIDKSNDESLVLHFADIERACVVSATEIEVTTLSEKGRDARRYNVGIDGVQRTKQWLLDCIAENSIATGHYVARNPAVERLGAMCEVDDRLVKLLARLGVWGDTGTEMGRELRTVMYAIAHQAYESIIGINQMAFYASKLGVPYTATRNDQRDLDWYAKQFGVSVEQICRDLSLPNMTTQEQRSIGDAALDDLISHGANLLAAIDAQIRQGKLADTAADRDDVDDSGGLRLRSNESYWQHERGVVERMISQARFARGKELT